MVVSHLVDRRVIGPLNRHIFVSLAAIVILAGLAPRAESAIIFTDAFTAKVQRANNDGSGIVDLVTAQAGIRHIVADEGSGLMYWTTVLGQIRRANLDGSDVTDLITGLNGPVGIDLDLVNGKMYWTNPGTAVIADKIQRANLDGSGIEDLIALADINDVPQGLALDLIGGKMYWGDADAPLIRRANLDGSGMETIVSGLSDPYDVAIDSANQKLYFGDNNSIQRANLDGTGLETLVTGLGSGFGLRGIDLDIPSGKMYWTELLDNAAAIGVVRRANLDGTDVETIVTGLRSPFGIEVLTEGQATVPEPSSFMLFGGMALLTITTIVRRTRSKMVDRA